MRTINLLFFCNFIVLSTVASNVLAGDDKDLDDIVGKKDFISYCGSCHGTDGKGDGPIVDYIKRKPLDLTQLTKSNNGHFPFERIWGVFDGSYTFAEHGTSEMPIWGYRFVQEGQHNNETDISTKARAKALNIILYLQVIQE